MKINMKKSLLFVISVLWWLSAYGQSNHLSFKGVPIDGPLDHYVQEMRQKEFFKVTLQGLKDAKLAFTL